MPVGKTTFETARNRSPPFLRQQRRQHGLVRSVKEHARMLLREHHHPSRVAQAALGTSGFGQLLSHAVVDDQPAMTCEDGRSATADLQHLPGRHGSREPVM